jgi:hypothetical protein
MGIPKLLRVWDVLLIGAIRPAVNPLLTASALDRSVRIGLKSLCIYT